MKALIQHSAVGNDIGRISGHEQGLETEADLLQPAGHVFAVHPRHDHVGDEQVDFARAFPGNTQGLIRTVRSQYRVAKLFQNPCGKLQDRGLVFNDKDDFTMAYRGIPAGFSSGCNERRVGVAGQVDFENGPFARFTVDIDKAFILFCDAIDRGQSKSRPWPRAFVVKKGSKILAAVSRSMPLPSSLTARIT